MNSVGQKLKKERELRGISLKEIADNTKINIRYLRALEEDKFDMLPGKFFIKSIIKTYANYLGLDEETILDQFHHTLQLKKEENTEQVKEEVPPTEIPRKFKLLLRTAGYAALFIIALVIIIFLMKGKQPDSVDEITITTDLPYSEEPPIRFLNTIIPDNGMLLSMTFNQETWIEIFSDRKLNFTGLKQPGDYFFTSAENEFLIHTGNAGGFTYRINGVQGKSLGRPGEVIRNLHITSSNFQQYLVDKPKKRSPGSLTGY